MKAKGLFLVIVLCVFQLNLIAQDQDSVVTLTTTKNSIDESESLVIRATIDFPNVNDIYIDFLSSGTAEFDLDYVVSFLSQGTTSTVAGGVEASYTVNSPEDVAFDGSDIMYVLQPGHNRILKFINGLDQDPQEIGMEFWSNYFHVDADGNIYATDNNNHSIKKTTDDGGTWTIVAGGNGQGSSQNKLNYPRGFDLDADGNIYIADMENHRIQKWLAGSTSEDTGETVAGGNGEGDAPNQLFYPHDVAIDANGDFYIIQPWWSEMRKWTVADGQGERQVENINSNYICIDSYGNVYIPDYNSHSIRKRSISTGNWTILVGNVGAGNSSTQLNQPHGIGFNSVGDLFVADRNNGRVQKVKLAPQIIIENGKTSGTLTIEANDDSSDEPDETIIMSPSAITNGVLASSDDINITLTDNDESPVIAFDLSSTTISENSATDVTLTATPSATSASDISIVFSTAGTATDTTEYMLSSTTLSINAGESSGSISISTNGLDDNIVEILKSIVFQVDNVSNATAPNAPDTLFLQSDDDPTATVSTSKNTFLENDYTVLTATLDTASSKNAIINYDLSGVATLDKDFEIAFAGKGTSTTVAGGNGSGNNANQLYYPSDVSFDDNGNTYILEGDHSRIRKWNTATNQEVSTIQFNNWGSRYMYVDGEGNIYRNDEQNHSILKLAVGNLNWTVVAGGNGGGSNANQLNRPYGFALDSEGNIYIADKENHRIQKWAAGSTSASSGETVAGGNGRGDDWQETNKLAHPADVALDANGDLYITQHWHGVLIYWKIGESERSNIFHEVNSERLSSDAYGNIYLSDQNNHSIKKLIPGATDLVVVSGGNGSGSNADQLNQPNGMAFDSDGNLYISDRENHRIQKVQLAPRILVTAGETVGTLTISGIDDDSDEVTESLILTSATIENVILASTTPITLEIGDNDEQPSITFLLSNSIITENSPTDVSLTAEASAISEKDISMTFSVTGTAVENVEYSVTSKTLAINAGESTGSISISTEGKDDELVEILKSIIFQVSEITNATSSVAPDTLFLESDDDPTATVSAAKSTMAENEVVEVTATLSDASSKDAIINYEISGTANEDLDFSTDFSGKGSAVTIAGGNGNGGNSNQLDRPYDVAFAPDGKLYILEPNPNRIRIWNTTTNLEESRINIPFRGEYFYIDSEGNIYMNDEWNHSIKKRAVGSTSWTIVAGGNGDGDAANQFRNPKGFTIDSEGNIYVADTENDRIQKWAEGASSGVTVAGGNGRGHDWYNNPSQLHSPYDIILDANGDYYISQPNTELVTYWKAGESERSGVIQNIRPSFSSKDQNGTIYFSDEQNHSIKKLVGITNVSTVIGGNGNGNSLDQFNHPMGLVFDQDGNLFISDLDNDRVQKVQLSSRILVPAGETRASIIITGIDDNSDELDETIILSPTTTENVTLSASEALTITIEDNDESPVITFSFSNPIIAENSSTSVQLFATPSYVSGKEISMVFSTAGDALITDEYILSNNTLFINAGEEKGSISIITDGLDNDDVDILKSILLEVETMVNATYENEPDTLFYENDDNPSVSLEINKTTIVEGESAEIVALTLPTSKDITINMLLSGAAKSDQDFTTSFLTKGEATTSAGGNGQGSSINQLSYPDDVDFDGDGNMYILEGDQSRIRKWDANTNQEIGVIQWGQNNWTNSRYMYVDIDGNIYKNNQENHSIVKLAVGATTWTTVAGGNGQGSDPNQLNRPMGFAVDANGNIYVADAENHRIQKWAPSASIGITVAGGNGNGQNWDSNPNQLYYPFDVAIDGAGNFYIAQAHNHWIIKWNAGATERDNRIENYRVTNLTSDPNGNIIFNDEQNYSYHKITLNSDKITTIIGGKGAGSNADQLNNAVGAAFDPDGNLYIADRNNSRIQKIQLHPKIIIKAGETEGRLVIDVIDDESFENSENIIFTPTTATNGILGSTDALELTIHDNDGPPLVHFSYSADKITENSTTDVNLIAKPTYMAGKDIIAYFSISGDAVEIEEFTLSSESITIPAGDSIGTISISTNGLDDDDVEILKSIVFTVDSMTNASFEANPDTLFIESDDDPTITIVNSVDTIAEHESVNIRATLNAASSKETTIAVKFEGDALLYTDFTTDFLTKGRETTVAGGNGILSNWDWYANPDQLYWPDDIGIDDLGNMFIWQSQRGQVVKWKIGETRVDTMINTPFWTNYMYVDAIGNIYASNDQNNEIIKFEVGATSWERIAGGAAGDQAAQLNRPKGFTVDAEGNIYIADEENNRIQKWAAGATEGVTVAGGNGENDWEGDNRNIIKRPYDVTIDNKGNLYILDHDQNWQRRITIWKEGESQRTSQITEIDPTRISSDSYGNVYFSEQDKNRINRVTGLRTYKTVVGADISGSNAGELNRPRGIAFDKDGNLFIADHANHRIQRVDLLPKLVIKAGETEGFLTIIGEEDELNAEGIETVFTIPTSATNGILNTTDTIRTDILDNTKSLTLNDSPFIGLSNGAVSWGDYDKDGDLDVAIMGTSATTGAVTAIYENRNGNFVDAQQNFLNLYDGDIAWVDINKDGWIDLVVSGYDTEARTKLYLNVEGRYFAEGNDYGLPQLFSTNMAWGDLDNDGDFDVAIAGIDENNEYVFYVYYFDPILNKFKQQSSQKNDYHWEGFINGDLKIVDVDLDGDNDIVYSGENSQGNPIGGIITNTYIQLSRNQDYDYGYYNEALRVKKSTFEVARFLSTSTNNLSIIVSGEDENENTVLSSKYFNASTEMFPKLRNGDISVADYDNNGFNDIVFTGENLEGVPITKLFRQDKYGGFSESDIVLKGLRNSTADWVDYDGDGDLDLFLTGIDDTGAQTLLYESDIVNKKNAAPGKISGLEAEDLGNGNIRFSWDSPEDDYSENLGYVLRLGTTPGGTELSNTESDLVTGKRLISKSAPIYTNFFEMQLDPGIYYWAVQAVDPGLIGGVFSDEIDFTLTYEWKILNQGGIIDRRIQGRKDPVIKLADVDNDSDMDLLYGSATYDKLELYKFEEKRLVRMVDGEDALEHIDQVLDAEVGDVNGDGTPDILVNNFYGSNYNLRLYMSTEFGYSSTDLDNGLYKANGRVIDLNNDGQAEVVVIGLSNALTSGKLKFYIYEYITSSDPPEFIKIDVSDQIVSLNKSSFDMGDIDNDQDIDLIISGFSTENGNQSFIYENITQLGGEYTFVQTDNNLVAVTDGTSNLIDIDGDGDLDAVITGTSGNSGDVFEIYLNMINEGSSIWPKLNNNGLTPMRLGKVDVGDFNGDGYSDLLYSGIVEGEGKATYLSEYDPLNKTFVKSAFDVSDIVEAEVEFGDFEGDGDLDFAISGEKKGELGTYIFRAYINVRNQSASVLESAAQNLNLKGSLFKSTDDYVVNEPPTTPVPNEVTIITNANVVEGGIPVEFSWQASTDDHTPTAGLTYAIKVGTTPGGEDVMSANANLDGTRKTAEKGNVEHNLKWGLSLPEGRYYWSVQAIDASYVGSAISQSLPFKVSLDEGVDDDADGDGVTNDDDECPDTPEGDAVDENGCTVAALLGDSNGDFEVNILDLVHNVDYILGNNPVHFVFQAADVNSDGVINVLDIVATVDLILNSNNKIVSLKSSELEYYSNVAVGEAVFYWEGSNLYVESEKAIAGIQIVFDKSFDFNISEAFRGFEWSEFGNGTQNSLMTYSFTGMSVEAGKTKVLTRLSVEKPEMDIEKVAVGTPNGFKLTPKYAADKEIPFDATLIISPNPTRGETSIHYYYSGQIDKVLIRIYDMEGRVHWSGDEFESINGHIVSKLNLGYLENGMYVVVVDVICDGEVKESEVRKLLISKN